MLKRYILLAIISIMLMVPTSASAANLEAPQDLSVYCDEVGTFVFRWVEPQSVTDLTNEISGEDLYVLYEIDVKVNDEDWIYNNKNWTHTSDGILAIEEDAPFHEYVDNIIHDENNAIEPFLVPEHHQKLGYRPADLANNTYQFRVRHLYEYAAENGGYNYQASPWSEVVTIGKGNTSPTRPDEPRPEVIVETPTTDPVDTPSSDPTNQTNSNISVLLDNNEIKFDTPPVIENGRTLVPFRQIFEALGAEVWFDEATNSAMGQKGEFIIQLPIGEPKAFVNGKEVSLDVSSKVTNGRTIVPLRFISENLGCNVTPEGDLSNLTIFITKQ